MTKEILKTERLILREFSLEDAQNMWALNEDADVIRYTGDPPFESVEDARNFLSNYTDYDKNGYGRWAVIEMESNAFLGWCGLKKHEEYTDLGFRFFKKYWNRGYATESALGCLKYAQSIGLKEVVGRAAQANLASIRVLEKCGFQFWKQDTCKGIDDAAYYKVIF